MTSHTNGTNGRNGSYSQPVTHTSSWTSKPEKPQHPPASPSGAEPGPFPPLATAQPHPQLKADRAGVTAAMEEYAQLVYRPGYPQPTQNGTTTVSPRKWQTGWKVDSKHIGWKDVKTLVDLVKSKLSIGGAEPVDDHTMLMERVIQIVAGLPTKSRNRVLLTDQLINELWYSLDHPVLNFIGEQYMYRSADGSNNNPLFPSMGAAGTTYARSVRPTIMPPGALPDPGLVYDTVMRRSNSGYRKHPNNVSSILWYWATIIIHDLFWTDYRDMNKSKTSSYLDLSPLYGSNQDMQDTIRTFRDGKLKPDAYADKRLNGMPPGVSVLLIMFNRFHNHVASHLAAINEGGRFTPPPGAPPGLSNPQPVNEDKAADEAHRKSAAAWKKYDEDLFQTARLVTSGLYINITLVDYVRNIVNLNRCDTTWTLDPRQEMGRDAGTTQGAASGTGNVVSAEFNLCYRWHSCISEKDDRWIQEFYHELFGKPATDVSMQDMVMGFAKFEKSIPDDPALRTFGGFQRDAATGKFNDDELVGCIADAIEDCAGAFGARNVPVCMRPVEILGILQGRRWHVAGLNEFRRHFGLKPYASFEELNADPEVASALRHLYEHPDFVELYPGLVAEQAKDPMVPGVGIAPTYTISRVVLSDAVCLVRGDRFYTTDYSPRALTNWGYREVQYDLGVNHGCCFSKLFLRAFPGGQFRADSVYAHYPMVIPAENRRILEALKRAEGFSWERPGTSKTGGGEEHRKVVTTVGGARQVLGPNSGTKYRSVWESECEALMGSAVMKKMTTVKSKNNSTASLAGDGWEGAVKSSFAHIMEELMRDKSYILAGSRHVDIVRDVGNLASVHFIARLFSLPLQSGSSSTSNKSAIYTADELYAVLTLIYLTMLHPTSDPVKAYPLRQATKTVAPQLGSLLESQLGKNSSSKDANGVSSHGARFVKALGMASGEAAWGVVMPGIVGFVPTLSAAFAQVVAYYLAADQQQQLQEVQHIANLPSTKDSDARLLGYASEALRRSAGGGVVLGGVREATVGDTVVEDGGARVAVHAGERVVVRLASQTTQEHSCNGGCFEFVQESCCFGRETYAVALTEMLRAVFCKGGKLRPTAGPQGELKRIVVWDEDEGEGGGYMTEDWSGVSPLPCSMRVCWDQ